MTQFLTKFTPLILRDMPKRRVCLFCPKVQLICVVGQCAYSKVVAMCKHACTNKMGNSVNFTQNTVCI